MVPSRKSFLFRFTSPERVLRLNFPWQLERLGVRLNTDTDSLADWLAAKPFTKQYACATARCFGRDARDLQIN